MKKDTVRKTTLSTMEQLRLVIYRPYLGRSHPRFAIFSRSRVTNPLYDHYVSHLTATRRAYDRLIGKRLRNDTVEEAYYNKAWYIKASSTLDHLVNRVESYRVADVDRAEYKRYTVLMATLEVVCSLILFADDPHYRLLTDEDICMFLFPLSKRSRIVINSLQIVGDDLLITSHLL